MKGIIYKFTSPSGKVYIGQTTSKNRKQQHFRSAKNGRKTKFYDAVRKYGFDNFKYEVLVTICLEDKCELKQILNWLERYYIWKYNSFGENGYNLTEGGDGITGRPAWNKGVKWSDEIIQKFKEGHKGSTPWNKGKTGTYSEEYREKISKANKGRTSNRKGVVLSEETKRKISEKLRKYFDENTVSEETRHKISDRLKIHFAEKRQEEAKSA